MSRLSALLAATAMLAACVSPSVRQVGLGECREGLRHGSWTLQVVDGPVVATGSFAMGRRHGLFTVYTTGGTKVAEIPYADGAKSGTIRLWYSEFAHAGAAGRRKLEAEYELDLPHGLKRSWWPSGANRGIERFRRGSLVEAEAWDEAGASVSRSLAERLSRDSGLADAEYYRILESEIDAYPPACAQPAGRVPAG